MPTFICSICGGPHSSHEHAEQDKREYREEETKMSKWLDEKLDIKHPIIDPTLPSQWAIISEDSDTPMALRPIDDKILVLVDKFKTGYECKTCDGKGHTGEECPNCKGSGSELFTNVDGSEAVGRCRTCTVGSGDGRKTLRFKPCNDCHGRQSLLIVPESNERKPTTGKVIAVGANANFYKVGTTVVFTNYTGTQFEINDRDLRVMKEKDVLCEAKYLKSEKSLEEKRYTDLDKVGM